MTARPAQQVSPGQYNDMMRGVVLDRAVNMWQPIATVVVTAGAGSIVNIPVRPVGLVKRFLVEISATFARSAALETHVRTVLGPANFLSNVQYTDLSNQTRVNTTGWHLHNVATARRQMAFGAAFASDTPTGIGSNFPVMFAPAAFGGGTQTLRMFYEVPVSYGDYDLRGAIWASVVNATMNLQLTINPNFSVASTANPTLACYQSSAAGLATLSSVTITVLQNYLDQLPTDNKGKTILPALDISTAYLLNNTAVTGLSVGQDVPIAYANFRSFMSTLVVYDNAGVLNPGSDMTAWKLQSANYTNILNYDPFVSSLLSRQIINDDFPSGMYYFDHRQKPINTVQYGNMQLVATPSAVTNATSQLLVGFEALALINQVQQAGSLYAN